MMLHMRANLSVNPSSIKFKFYDSLKGSNRRIIQNNITDKHSVKKNYLKRKIGITKIRQTIYAERKRAQKQRSKKRSFLLWEYCFLLTFFLIDIASIRR